MVLCNGTPAAGVIRMKCASFENVVKHSLLNCYHSRMLLLALGCESLIFVHAAKSLFFDCSLLPTTKSKPISWVPGQTLCSPLAQSISLALYSPVFKICSFPCSAVNI